jgi:hypothetical protein
MSELSPEEYIDKLERHFRLRERIRRYLVDVAVSGLLMTDPMSAQAVFKEIHKTDTLPHD